MQFLENLHGIQQSLFGAGVAIMGGQFGTEAQIVQHFADPTGNGNTGDRCDLFAIMIISQTDFTTDICNYSLHDVISTNSFIEFAINTRILKTDAAELLLSLCKSTELRSILLNYINETNSYNDNFDNYKI